MLLIKCDCGCHFTVKNDFFNSSHRLGCQNCRKTFYITSNSEICEIISELHKNGFELYNLPDDSEFTYRCKL